jgi:hypothetical protein
VSGHRLSTVKKNLMSAAQRTVTHSRECSPRSRTVTWLTDKPLKLVDNLHHQRDLTLRSRSPKECPTCRKLLMENPEVVCYP